MDAENMAFRFLDLSPELRNMVYDLVLPEHHSVSHRHHPKPFYATRRSPRGLSKTTPFTPQYNHKAQHKKAGYIPSLLLVNKQVREETAEMFYARNCISIRLDLSYRDFLVLPRQIQDEVSRDIENIKDLHLDIRVVYRAGDPLFACGCRPRQSFSVFFRDNQITGVRYKDPLRAKHWQSFHHDCVKVQGALWNVLRHSNPGLVVHDFRKADS